MIARPWWQQPLRVYQPNLRLIDGGQVPSDLVEQAENLSANAMVVNAGGAFAFYPTKLDCQERAPSLIGDLFGGIVKEGRSKGIRVMGRLEVSVKSKGIYDRHPEWFYVDAEGQPHTQNRRAGKFARRDACRSGRCARYHPVRVPADAFSQPGDVELLGG